MASSEVEYAKPLSEEECKRLRFHAYSPDGIRIATFQWWVDLCRFVYSNPTTRWEMVILDEVQKESQDGKR